MSAAGNDHHLIDSLLMWVPVCVSIGFGILYMGSRFAAALSEHLKERPESVGAILLLAMMVGTVSLVGIAVCAALGAGIGFSLRAVVQHMISNHDE
jgi:hypothetical protein